MFIQYTSEGGILVIMFLFILFISPFFTSLFNMTFGNDKMFDRENYTRCLLGNLFYFVYGIYEKSGDTFWNFILIILAIFIKISYKSTHQKNKLHPDLY